MEPLELTIFACKFLLVFIPLGLIPLMIFLERKGAAVIQDRPGPNRAAIPIPGIGRIRGFGMVHNFSDVVKLLTKEQFIPERAHRAFYLLAPMIPVATAVLTPALIPWFAPFAYRGAEGVVTVSGSIIEADSSLLLLFAMSALTVYGVVLGSWGSNSKYSLLGGLRSSAMMISYEVSMGLSVLGLILVVGSFGLTEIVRWQEAHTWGLVVQPVGFLLFVVSMFAETGRTPFDVAEGESEIVGGFHTEYSAIKFALFFMGEYAHMVVAAALMATVFCGGWSLLPVPGFDTAWVTAHLGWVLGGVTAAIGLVLLGLARLVHKQRRRYPTLGASDTRDKVREYRLFEGLFGGLAVASFLGAGAAMALVHPEPGPDGLYSAWVGVLTAITQLHIVLAKTLFFCWLFVWVRWTLPRLRYDQIMGLGWKVMLNLALVNLLVTAIVARLVRGEG